MVHPISKPGDSEKPREQKTPEPLPAVRSSPASSTHTYEDDEDDAGIIQDSDLESQPTYEGPTHSSELRYVGTGRSIPYTISTGTFESIKPYDNESALQKLNAHFANWDKKIHRFPLSLCRLGRYHTPENVPICPYYDVKHSIGSHDENKNSIKMLRKLKNVSAHHFLSDTDRVSLEDMLSDFSSFVGDARGFFSEDVNYKNEDRKLMYHMLRDGCFLLQYMDFCTTNTWHSKMPPALVSYFDMNQVVINRDIMLLENQLPWVVIEALQGFKKVKVDVNQFIGKMARTLQLRKGDDTDPPHLFHDEPPHLLGAVRFYKIGGNNNKNDNNNNNEANNKQSTKRFSLLNYCCYSSSGLPTSSVGTRTVSKSISAIELAEIGIKLTVSKTANFTDMGIKKRLFCTEIFLPHLLLDETRLCWLINMVAFELCVAATFKSNTDKNYVSSYLLVLAMLMDREEDVHKLRSNGIVQGELTNKETLDFFKALVKHISGGPLYLQLMQGIEEYKLNRWMWIKVHKFIYKNYKTIAAVLSIISVLVGIFKALFSLRQQ